MSEPAPLEIFVRCFKKVPDPRSKRGVSQPFSALLAVVLLGLLSNGERTLREVREKCNADPMETAERLGFEP